MVTVPRMYSLPVSSSSEGRHHAPPKWQMLDGIAPYHPPLFRGDDLQRDRQTIIVTATVPPYLLAEEFHLIQRIRHRVVV